jgi:hypothetical protein
MATVLGFPLPAGALEGPPAVPRAECGPGSVPERAMQGRVTAGDYAEGLRCNAEFVGQVDLPVGGFRTYRYVDPQGRECAYYDVFPGAASDRRTAFESATSTAVVDMSDPTHPVVRDRLVTPGSRSPHESLSLHAGRGLLAAVMGTFSTAPGIVDLYDLT